MDVELPASPPESVTLSFIGLEGLVNPRGLSKIIDDLVVGQPSVIVLGNVHTDQAYRTRIRDLMTRRDYRLAARTTPELIFTYLGVDVVSIDTHPFPSRGGKIPSNHTYSMTRLRCEDREWNLVTFDLPLGALARHQRTAYISHLVSHSISRDSKAGVMVGNFGFDEWQDLVDLSSDTYGGGGSGWEDVWSLKGGAAEARSSELGRPHRVYVRLLDVSSFESTESLSPGGERHLDESGVLRKTLRVRGHPR